jgi:hypothetical protein
LPICYAYSITPLWMEASVVLWADVVCSSHHL